MKLSLITMHRIFNYGSVLQTYATKKVFEDLGYEIELVDYMPGQCTLGYIMGVTPEGLGTNKLKRVLYKGAKLFSVALKKKSFLGFVKKNCRPMTRTYKRFEDIKAQPPEADAYVVGSDQVWNSFYNGGVDRFYFLDYVPSDKPKYAFVSSFGKTELDDSEKEETKTLLSSFKAISVRENTSLDVLRSIDLDGVWLIDPTLQITGDEWRKLSSKRLVKEKYVALMLLYDEDPGATEIARAIADKYGYKLVKISWDMRTPDKVDKLLTHRSPADFLSVFDNAEIVVTNSFHGLAFSIDLNKPFIMVPRKQFNSRIESLLSLVGLSERLVSDTETALSVLEKEIDYGKVNAVLDAEREKAKTFIKENIK